MNKHQTKIIFIYFFTACLFTSCASKQVNTYLDKAIEHKITHLKPYPKEENINGIFPKEIYIKTATQTFNDRYYFLLHDGRIYYKTIPPDNKVPAWALFPKQGLPANIFDQNFHKPESIVTISADDNELYVISNKARVYRFVFDAGMQLQNLYWSDKMGWPEESPLVLNNLVENYRSWAVATRTKNTLWYEDRYGNQHHYGTMGIATCYYLCSNGQEIRYSDSGLPSDFSHTVLGPERGAFIAESLSASGSTIFLINDAGEMYTRLADFDTLGCDPMFFKYTYEQTTSKIPGTDYRSNYTPWALPAEDWKKQPPIVLMGKARISKRITIDQNGYGNKARELRVAGSDYAGKSGYYYKQISDTIWKFKVTPLQLTPGDWLNADMVKSGKGSRGKSSDKHYVGRIWQKGSPVETLKIQIPDFNINEGSCSFIVSYKNESVSLFLHPVDSWTYVTRYNPGYDNSPKLMMFTLIIPEETKSNISEEFKKLLYSHFFEHNKKTFSLFGEATTDYLYIKDTQLLGNGLLILLTRDDVPVPVKPDLLRKFAIGNDSLIEEFNSEHLLINDINQLTKKDDVFIETLLQRNINFKKKLVNTIKLHNSYQKSSNLSYRTYSAFNIFSHVTLLFLIDFPKIHTLTRHGNDIMGENRQTMNFTSQSKLWLYTKVHEIIELRIEMYSALLRAFRQNQPKPKEIVYYRENYSEYYSQLGIADTLEGAFSLNNTTTKARLTHHSIIKGFPHLVIQSSVDSMEGSYIVDFNSLAKDLFHYGGTDFKKKPFVTDITISQITPSLDQSSGRFNRLGFRNTRHEFKGTFIWNGNQVQIEKSTPPWQKRVNVFTSYKLNNY